LKGTSTKNTSDTITAATTWPTTISQTFPSHMPQNLLRQITPPTIWNEKLIPHWQWTSNEQKLSPSWCFKLATVN